MDGNKKSFIASVSSIESSDLYMTIKTIMFTSPSSNLNGVRCSLDFMSEIVENQFKYIGLPLCIDTKKVEEGRLDKLGHCYNAKTDTFESTMIGSFYKFEMEHIGNGETALVGYARVLKRNKAICAALSKLFLENRLKFSFEISCKEYAQLEDGTILIDRNEGNALEGMAVVSFPACPEAVATELVAEIKNLEKETETMPKNEKIVIHDGETVVEAAPVVAEETGAEEPKDNVEVAECEKSEPKEEEVVETETAACGKEEKAECGKEKEAAESMEDEVEDPEPEDEKECDAACGKKKKAEADFSASIDEIDNKIKNLENQIAELIESTKSINAFIASLNEKKEEKKEELAEVNEDVKEVEEIVVAEANPFVEDTGINEVDKYHLLKEVPTNTVKNYTLI